MAKFSTEYTGGASGLFLVCTVLAEAGYTAAFAVCTIIERRTMASDLFNNPMISNFFRDGCIVFTEFVGNGLKGFSLFQAVLDMNSLT
jgi:hypothetical protein